MHDSAAALKWVKLAPAVQSIYAIAVTPDDATVVSVNRDVGTVTIAHATYGGDGQPTLTKTIELDVGGTKCEPWEVTIDACGLAAISASIARSEPGPTFV